MSSMKVQLMSFKLHFKSFTMFKTFFFINILSRVSFHIHAWTLYFLEIFYFCFLIQVCCFDLSTHARTRTRTNTNTHTFVHTFWNVPIYSCRENIIYSYITILPFNQVKLFIKVLTKIITITIYFIFIKLIFIIFKITVFAQI